MFFSKLKDFYPKRNEHGFEGCFFLDFLDIAIFFKFIVFFRICIEEIYPIGDGLSIYI
jgi:hypothetical protein